MCAIFPCLLACILATTSAKVLVQPSMTVVRARSTGLNPSKTDVIVSVWSMQYSSCEATKGAENPQVMPIFAKKESERERERERDGKKKIISENVKSLESDKSARGIA